MFGFYRLGAASPELRVADPAFNCEKIIEAVLSAERHHAAAVVFPELAASGYTCADLFHQPVLLDKALEAILKIAADTAKHKIITIVGAPFAFRNSVYNCAFVLQHGIVKGIVPKTFNPNYREFYEKRWFKSGRNVRNIEAAVPGLDYKVPFGTDLLFESGRNFKFGVELCEDMWSVIPPSSYQAIAGATVIFNLSASNELVSKSEYRRQLVEQQSARCISAYAYTSAGV
ncbi:MAG: nitrilase-related carbon-nitrogen hydrolase, partial [Victivallaceae bacterium]